MAQRAGSVRSASALDAAHIARRYYLDGRQKSEIADELGISRFKVARVLDEAREAGIVQITIKVPTNVDLTLGDEVAQLFGLRRAIVVNTPQDDRDAAASMIGQSAADLLAGMLDEGDVLGLAWGNSLTAMCEALQGRSGADVVQLVGGVRAAATMVSGVELVRRAAERTGGTAFPLNAPLVVGSEGMAAELLADEALALTRDKFSALTVCAFGVGSWVPPRSALLEELPLAARSELLELGAVADLCGIPIDQDGHEIDSPVARRVVGARLNELRRVPEVIALAMGAERERAITGALRTGVVSTLVTEASVASALIRANS